MWANRQSARYSRLEGTNEGDLDERNVFSEWFSQFRALGFKFWLTFSAVCLTVLLGFLLLASSSHEKNLLQASVVALEPENNDIALLYGKQKWPIPDLADLALLEEKKTGVPKPKSSSTNVIIIIINATTAEEALAAAVQSQVKRRQQEDKMEASGSVLQLRSPASKHQHLFKKSSPQTKKLATDGFSMDQASQFVAKKLKLTKKQADQSQLKMNLTKTPEEMEMPCIPEDSFPKCKPDLGIYRAVDGMCNNLKNSQWGSTNQPYRRVLKPDYADGISAPRIALSGLPLPHPRKLSTIIHYDQFRPDKMATLMMPAMGQFIGHDVSSIVLENGDSRGSGGLACCVHDVATPEAHPECFPMPPSVEINTTVAGAKCTNFWRSSPYPSCEFGSRDQFSQNTAFLDASVIYGSTQTSFNKLRGLDTRNATHGYVSTYAAQDGRRLLGVATNLIGGCDIPQETQFGRFCFTSGDTRVNENMPLTALHLVFVRHHNNIADQLTALNGQSENVYMETREIIIAQFQHIVYNEFLPILLGKDLMKISGSELLTEGYYTEYDETVNAMISNVFATAAYRVGHSMIEGQINLLDGDHKIMETIPMHELLVDPFRLWKAGNFDGVLRGYAFTSSSSVDTYFSAELTRKLFQDKHLFDGRNLFRNQNGSTDGLDLAALNIHRGRDHGIPSYTSWRKLCALSPVENFGHLIGIWDENTVTLARDLYATVHDIDPYTGMLAELHLPGAMVGPTVGCLLADQFLRLRKGDRFWYESSSRPKPFSPAQLQEIRKTSLARLICESGDDIQKMQARVFEKPSETNPILDCSDHENIPILNLIPWANSQ